MYMYKYIYIYIYIYMAHSVIPFIFAHSVKCVLTPHSPNVVSLEPSLPFVSTVLNKISHIDLSCIKFSISKLFLLPFKDIMVMDVQVFIVVSEKI